MNKIFTKILNYPSVFYQKKKYIRNLPVNPLANDIYLVSFPKSGNTWLRFLIANTLKSHYQIQRNVNFFTIHEFIPDIHQCRGFLKINEQGIFPNPEVPRIIKSHFPYNLYYQRAMLLVRDPRDVMISYWYHRKRDGNIPEDYSLSDFIRHEKYGVKQWKNHTESWIKNIKDGQMVHLFRYEDFLNNTQTELHRFMDLLGIEVEESNLSKAIMLSSKENMRKSETNHDISNFEIKKPQKGYFVRDGIVTGVQELSDLDRQFIEDATRDIALDIGYHY